jgi:hypothetical protein
MMGLFSLTDMTCVSFTNITKARMSKDVPHHA